jgi:hypothetical protein
LIQLSRDHSPRFPVIRFFALLFMLATTAWAEAVERDLGNGLTYVRVRQSPNDLPAKPAGRVTACVIDLRYVAAESDAAEAFATWLKSRATPRSPVFVLANADTSSALLKTVGRPDRVAGVVVIGIESPGFSPDVAVKSSAADERRAYDALEQGVTIAALLKDNPNKVRNDEASLSKDRVAEASADAADDALTGKRPALPVDLTLQRAVHLHRALVALKKI